MNSEVPQSSDAEVESESLRHPRVESALGNAGIHTIAALFGPMTAANTWETNANTAAMSEVFQRVTSTEQDSQDLPPITFVGNNEQVAQLNTVAVLYSYALRQKLDPDQLGKEAAEDPAFVASLDPAGTKLALDSYQHFWDSEEVHWSDADKES